MKPRYIGQKRTIDKFLLFPKYIGYKWYWLCFVHVGQVALYTGEQIEWVTTLYYPMNDFKNR
jgi:hypothetical protein